MTYTSSNTTAPHSNNAAFQSQSPYQQRTTQKDNPTQKLIKQAVDFLLQQLKEGKSETLTAYLAAMARFHAYSFGNILSIARQRPTATHVAGFHAWKELGRFVKRGEKGIQILAPMAGKRRSKNDADRNSVQDDSAKPQPVLIGFRAVYVFDVAQTEGADLPEFEQNISGEVGEHRERLVEFLARQNIALEYNENIAPALGVSYGGKIALLPGQSKAEDFTSLVVGQAIGLEMGRASSDYIQMYAGNAALLAESLEVVQRTSAVILDAITGESATKQNAPLVFSPEAQDAIAEVA
jgi:hypothetical protein